MKNTFTLTTSGNLITGVISHCIHSQGMYRGAMRLLEAILELCLPQETRNILEFFLLLKCASLKDEGIFY